MRSAIYRRPNLLRLSASRTRQLSFARPASSFGLRPESRDRDTSFPLYRPDPQPSYVPEQSIRPREVDPRSLPSDKRIRKTAKIQLTEKAIQDLPELQEDELRDFYAAVMESGREEDPYPTTPLIDGPASSLNPVKRLTSDQRRGILQGLEGRFLSSSDQAGPSRLAIDTRAGESDGQSVLRIVERLRAVVPETEGRVSLGLVSRTEWSVMLDEVARSGDGREAEALLDLMSAHGVTPDDAQITQVMEVYANAGRVTDVARVHDLMAQSGLRIQDVQQDLLIQAYLNHSPPLILPAIDMLSSLATAGTPLPQSSYDILLSHLTTIQSTSTTRSLAWDLFANMRLTAHPTPTPRIYSTMISACANSRDPQPERARDLWLELLDTRTPSGPIQPERTEYDAIIRALSSTKSTYLEAFDLLRQMLAKHTEATFVPFDESDTERWSRFVPTAETFTALLEGTKRAGDLNRARWVLNEVVRLQGSGLGKEWRGVDEELMSGVFMTYASWKPVVRRTLVRGQKEQAGSHVREGIETEDLQKDDSQGAETQASNAQDYPGMTTLGTEPQDLQAPSDPSHAAPLTAADAIREVDVLFHQILQDTSSPDSDSGPFCNVRLSARLVNSYLSVHLAHASSISAARQVWDETWGSVGERGVRMNGWSMMQVLERCAAGEQGKDREAATEWGKVIWGEYTSFARGAGLDLVTGPTSSGSIQGTKPEVTEASNASRTGTPNLYLLGLGPRQLERTFRSMIRILALSPSTTTTESTSLLSTFYETFPPTSILRTYTPTPHTPFQIRITDRAGAESDIPPHLLWSDVDVLHQRLVREGKKGEVGWLKWVCKSYEVALRKRRRWRLKGKGGQVKRSTGTKRIEDVNESEEGGELEDWA